MPFRIRVRYWDFLHDQQLARSSPLTLQSVNEEIQFIEIMQIKLKRLMTKNLLPLEDTFPWCCASPSCYLLDRYSLFIIHFRAVRFFTDVSIPLINQLSSNRILPGPFRQFQIEGRYTTHNTKNFGFHRLKKKDKNYCEPGGSF